MTTYVCPMHPEVKSDKKEKCSKCGMDLVVEEKASKEPLNHKVTTDKESYTPLFIIFGLILLVAITISIRDFFASDFVWQNLVTYFMAGFFITFAGFKIIDLKGFAQGYSTYDLLAKKFSPYGYIYPFIELFFGLAMILTLFTTTILYIELLVMTASGIGVAIKIAKKEKFQCVCLGTFLKVPLTKVTLVEDFGMAFLALILLLST